MPNHPSVIARPTPTGFAGRYVHNDGHPDTRIPLLHQLYAAFARDLDAMQRHLVDDHPAGWSQLGPDPTVNTGWVNGRSSLGYRHGVCYCHGDRSEAPQVCTEANTEVGSVDCVYVLTPGGIDVLTDFGEDDVAVWRVAMSVPWSAAAQPAPAPLTPEAVSAILRDPDSRFFPTRITVFCDRCGLEETGEYLVHEDMTKSERLAVARKHLVETKGWEHDADDGDDFCPVHASSSA